jgi:hypothetical protein
MSVTFNSKTYTNDVNRTPDIMRYLGPAHTLSTNDVVELGRTAPKKTADYAGKGRARFKLTRNATDGTDSLGDIIVDVQISTPVGTQESEQDAILADLAAYFATASAESLFQDQKIVQV